MSLNDKGYNMIETFDAAVYVKIAAYLGAAFVVGIGSIGPAIGQGRIASEACKNIGKYPESAGKIRTAMIIGLGLVESCCIYAFIIALILLLKS